MPVVDCVSDKVLVDKKVGREGASMIGSETRLKRSRRPIQHGHVQRDASQSILEINMMERVCVLRADHRCTGKGEQGNEEHR
jgi:hypothetical protein